MKLSVYKIKSVQPTSDEHYHHLCDLFNLPNLKFNSVEFLGQFSHYINKSELKKHKKIEYKYYDESINDFVNGLLLVDCTEKLFVKL